LALKLPNLEPLRQNDPSLASSSGFAADHLVLAISYDNRPGSGPGIKDDIAAYVAGTNYLGENPFVDYREYQFLAEFKSDVKYLYLGNYQMLFVSNSPSSNSSSFPPDFFLCNQYGSGTPSCTFRVAGHFDQPVLGHYFIEYFLSRDYFSAIPSISYCVGKLYQSLRYQ